MGSGGYCKLVNNGGRSVDSTKALVELNTAVRRRTPHHESVAHIRFYTIGKLLILAALFVRNYDWPLLKKTDSRFVPSPSNIS